MLREPLTMLARLALNRARAVHSRRTDAITHHMARFLLAAAFMTAWFTVGAGLLFSNFGDGKIYAYGALGGIGFALVSWGPVRRFARPS